MSKKESPITRIVIKDERGRLSVTPRQRMSFQRALNLADDIVAGGASYALAFDDAGEFACGANAVSRTVSDDQRDIDEAQSYLESIISHPINRRRRR